MLGLMQSCQSRIQKLAFAVWQRELLLLGKLIGRPSCSYSLARHFWMWPNDSSTCSQSQRSINDDRYYDKNTFQHILYCCHSPTKTIEWYTYSNSTTNNVINPNIWILFLKKFMLRIYIYIYMHARFLFLENRRG